MIKRVLLRIKESIWFIPSVSCILAFVLALMVIAVDTIYSDSVRPFIPSFLLTDVGLAQTTLGAISAALLTMTTITFSTIMVVLTTYSSQFSPRTLKNFTTSSTTMTVLGIFMGGFVFSILTLLFMRKSQIEHLVISATVGVIVSFICLAFFAYFIHNVATSIQVSKLLRDLTEDSINTIGNSRQTLKKEKCVSVQESCPDISVFSNVELLHGSEYGYIQIIDFENLMAIAKQKDVVIELKQSIGQFVTRESALAAVYHNHEPIEVNIDTFITVGDERETIHDIHFSIQKIVEVALRAISPGINDPNTAISCIHYLRVPLVEAFKTGGGYSLYNDEEENLRIICKCESNDELLYNTFHQVCFYGREDVSILIALLDTMIYIAEHSEKKVKIIIREFLQYISQKFVAEYWAPLDHERVNERRAALLKEVDF
ncbi:DUF2254 domain-containing protein [Halobacillus yeomjeoni]|uniref:DUF2254 domain-containing protein n=1 Tax=Halobacillus yeomjeoni TaxID=311194 RepID=UPI001CD4B354|nr:DUF2254 domain-containing protein [Halobacillus yeomjeoni]MCA0984223.1 DUF2254 domain-containing protein [Halobacillus yeomjeoni]